MVFRFRAAVEQARKSDDLCSAALLRKDRIRDRFVMPEPVFRAGSMQAPSRPVSSCLNARARIIRDGKRLPTSLAMVRHSQWPILRRTRKPSSAEQSEIRL